MSKEVTVELYQKAGSRRGSTPAVYLVKRGGNVVGVVEKYPDTRTEKHPWKAVQVYTGDLLGVFYGANAKAMAVMAASG
jgi:hypothetical protein